MENRLRKPLIYSDIERLKSKLEMEKKKVRSLLDELSYLTNSYYKKGIKKPGDE